MDGITKLIKLGMKIIVRIETRQEQNDLRQEQNDLRFAEVSKRLDKLIAVAGGVAKRPRSNR